MNEMDKDEDMVGIFRALLLSSGKSVSYEFSEVLVTFLMENISDVGIYDAVDAESKQPVKLSIRSRNMSKLFNLAFASLTKYPKNEAALLPHLQKLIIECSRRSMKEPAVLLPGPYLNLLRSMFRIITSGKFEASYKELIPLIPTILNGFYRIYNATDDEALRFMIVELMK